METKHFHGIQTLNDLQTATTFLKNQGLEKYNLSSDTELVLCLGKLKEHKTLQIGATGIANQIDNNTGKKKQVFYIELVEENTLYTLLQDFLKKKLEESEVGGHA